ncbi:hypothetical protein CRYUN_Cryun16bG0099500 [Craigia yunnanensis]
MKQLYFTSLAFISEIIAFGGLPAPTLELKLGIGGTSYEDFICNMHQPLQLSLVNPIVASFPGRAVGVISALMLIEANNVEQQEKKSHYRAPQKQESSQMARLIRNKQVIPTNLLTRFLNSPSSFLTHPQTISKRSFQTLAYEEIEANPNKPYTHTALILHGLLGSARNWRSFSRNLASSLSTSPSSAEIEGLDPPHDMVNAAKDLGNLRWLFNHMIELGFSKSLSEWIGTNLKKSGERETWGFNLEGAVQMFHSYREMSYWSLLEHPPKGLEIEIVSAEKSDQWAVDTINQLERLASEEGDGSAGKISVHVLPNSGHWVHVDNPKGLLEVVAPKLKSLMS